MTEDAEDAKQRLTLAIRAGILNAAAALEDATAELGKGHAALAELKALAKTEEVNQRALESTWTEATDNDRLAEAFRELRTLGIIALEHAGYTQADGWADAHEEAEKSTKGAVFFTEQDTERAVGSGGLALAFGAFGAGDSVAIATKVCEVLRRHGFDPAWSGVADARIELKPFTWRRRKHFTSVTASVAILGCDPSCKMALIKLLRDQCGIELKAAKAALDALPPPTVVGDYPGPPWVVMRGIPKHKADPIIAALKTAGAVMPR